MCVTGRDVLPVARQHRFIHHRDEEGTAGVEESGDELQVPRVVDSLLATFSRHRRGLRRSSGGSKDRRVVSRGGILPGLVTARV